MTAKRTEMHRLQELVRLHRLNTGAREVARVLGLGPNTERRYREAQRKTGLLEGAVEALADLEELKVPDPRTPSTEPCESVSWRAAPARRLTPPGW